MDEHSWGWGTIQEYWVETGEMVQPINGSYGIALHWSPTLPAPANPSEWAAFALALQAAKRMPARFHPQLGATKWCAYTRNLWACHYTNA